MPASRLDDSSLLTFLRGELAVEKFTVHGMRSSIRDWGGLLVDGRQRFAGDVMERVLAHAKRGVEGAYHRDRYVQERIGVMQAWSGFLLFEGAGGPPPPSVGRPRPLSDPGLAIAVRSALLFPR